eukprot:g12597.t1
MITENCCIDQIYRIYDVTAFDAEVERNVLNTPYGYFGGTKYEEITAVVTGDKDGKLFVGVIRHNSAKAFGYEYVIQQTYRTKYPLNTDAKNNGKPNFFCTVVTENYFVNAIESIDHFGTRVLSFHIINSSSSNFTAVDETMATKIPQWDKGSCTECPRSNNVSVQDIKCDLVPNSDKEDEIHISMSTCRNFPLGTVAIKIRSGGFSTHNFLNIPSLPLSSSCEYGEGMKYNDTIYLPSVSDNSYKNQEIEAHEKLAPIVLNPMNVDDKNANNFFYKCSANNQMYHIYNGNDLIPAEKAVLRDLYGEKSPIVYACAQRCHGSCIQQGQNALFIQKKNFYVYKCSTDESKVYYVYNASILLPYQEKYLSQVYANKPDTSYACIQGCAGKCVRTGPNMFSGNMRLVKYNMIKGLIKIMSAPTNVINWIPPTDLNRKKEVITGVATTKKPCTYQLAKFVVDDLDNFTFGSNIMSDVNLCKEENIRVKINDDDCFPKLTKKLNNLKCDDLFGALIDTDHSTMIMMKLHNRLLAQSLKGEKFDFWRFLYKFVFEFWHNIFTGNIFYLTGSLKTEELFGPENLPESSSLSNNQVQIYTDCARSGCCAYVPDAKGGKKMVCISDIKKDWKDVADDISWVIDILTIFLSEEATIAVLLTIINAPFLILVVIIVLIMFLGIIVRILHYISLLYFSAKSEESEEQEETTSRETWQKPCFKFLREVMLYPTYTKTSRDQYFFIDEFESVQVSRNVEGYDQLSNICKYRFNVVTRNGLEKSAFVGQKIQVFLNKRYLGHITKVDYENNTIEASMEENPNARDWPEIRNEQLRILPSRICGDQNWCSLRGTLQAVSNHKQYRWNCCLKCILGFVLVIVSWVFLFIMDGKWEDMKENKYCDLAQKFSPMCVEKPQYLEDKRLDGMGYVMQNKLATITGLYLLANLLVRNYKVLSSMCCKLLALAK